MLHDCPLLINYDYKSLVKINWRINKKDTHVPITEMSRGGSKKRYKLETSNLLWMETFYSLKIKRGDPYNK